MLDTIFIGNVRFRRFRRAIVISGPGMRARIIVYRSRAEVLKHWDTVKRFAEVASRAAEIRRRPA